MITDSIHYINKNSRVVRLRIHLLQGHLICCALWFSELFNCFCMKEICNLNPPVNKRICRLWTIICQLGRLQRLKEKGVVETTIFETFDIEIWSKSFGEETFWAWNLLYDQNAGISNISGKLS